MNAGSLASAEIAIREASEGDCKALTELMLRSRAYQGRYHSIIADYPVTPAMAREGGLWLVKRDAMIVGFYRLDLANAELDLMFVDDAAQGSGIGKSLIAHLRNFAAKRGLAAVRIVSHPPSVDFYRRMGAVDVGISKAKSADGWDRPILELTVR